MEKKKRVLFLSTGNTTRSQMAEGYLRDLAGDEFEAASAGIEATSLNPLAVEVMREVGVDISQQKAKDVKQSLQEHFGYVITVCDSARERAPVFPFTPFLGHWSVYDPETAPEHPEEKREVFRRVRDEIRAKVESFISEANKQKPDLAKTATAR